MQNARVYGIIKVGIMPLGAVSLKNERWRSLSSLKEEVKISFCLLFTRGEVVAMVTWELLILFCSLLVAIIKLVYDICNNNKKR